MASSSRKGEPLPDTAPAGVTAVGSAPARTTPQTVRAKRGPGTTRPARDTQPATTVKAGDSDDAELTKTCPRCTTSVPVQFYFCGSCGFNLSGVDDGLAFRDPLIGAVIGDRYRLLSRIGIGGMGTVYKAEHVHMGKVVAVKLLHGDLSRDVSMMRRFTREARAASRLSSPHTVSVFDYGQNDGLIYLVMEYLQGADLGQILRQEGALDLVTTARIVTQVADSLSEAHDCGIVHRDLKPENIFVCADDFDAGGELVKVLDFGLAKLRATREESLVSTAHGNIIGTPYYMSPEQISGRDVDFRSDIYSLAAVCFKLLTGEPPYHHENPVAVLGQHVTGDVPRPSERNPEIESVDDLLMGALAKQPSDRPASVRRFSEALNDVVRDPLSASRLARSIRVGASSIEEVSTRRDFDRFERRLKARRAGSILFALLLLAGAGYAFWWGVIEGNFERADAESEPNDSPVEANRLSVGQPLTGFIGRPAVGQRADNDFFRIENESDGPIVLSLALSGVPGLDLVVKAYDPDARELLTANSGGVGEPERVPNVLLSQRYLYVQVREYWVRNRPASFNLDNAYTLTASARLPRSNEEVEPNERVTGALPLRHGDAFVGLIGWAGDVDIFRAPELPAGGTMVDVDLEVTGDLDLELIAYDITGAAVRRWNEAAAGEAEQVSFFASPEPHGALFLGVAAVNDSEAAPDDFYTLSVSFRPMRFPLGPWHGGY